MVQTYLEHWGEENDSENTSSGCVVWHITSYFDDQEDMSQQIINKSTDHIMQWVCITLPSVQS